MKTIISLDCFPLKLKIRGFCPAIQMIPSSPVPERSTLATPNVLWETGKGGLLKFILQYTSHAYVLHGQRGLGGSGNCVMRLH